MFILICCIVYVQSESDDGMEIQRSPKRRRKKNRYRSRSSTRNWIEKEGNDERVRSKSKPNKRKRLRFDKLNNIQLKNILNAKYEEVKEMKEEINEYKQRCMELQNQIRKQVLF